jgi:hypothetical protein
MSNPTSNFNWQMPTATDLVTDLPADFEVFGQAVDSSMADLLGGTTGQVLAKNSNTNMDFVWVAQDDSNAIQNSIVDAKGDLIAASGNDTPARLAVGANDLLVTAASGEATGLKYTGGYTDWTPTYSGFTLGNGTLIARYSQVGKTVRFSWQVTFGSTTAFTSSYPTISLPVTLSVHSAQISARYEDTGAQVYLQNLYLNDSGTFYLITNNTAGTYLVEGSVSATVPFTWTTNDKILVSGTYEVA